VFHTLRSHSALGELSKSGRLAVECQKARLVQAPLIPAPADLARPLAETPDYKRSQRARDKSEALFAVLKRQIKLRRV
jgi:hypothetical protein